MSGKSLEDKVAIVTGGTRGIGRAIAQRLLLEGARVAICGREQTSVDDALAAFAAPGKAIGRAADVSKQYQVREFFTEVKRHFGAVHVLVNNAGSGIFRSVADLLPEEWDRMIGLNLSGVYYCCHEIVTIFRDNPGGDVINIGSLAGKNAFAGGAGYNATKFGLKGFSEAMMLDHRQEDIRVSSIMPGSVNTEFGGSAQGDWKIAPEDIADVVAMMLRMPRRTNISRVEIRPSMPPGKG
jgi:NADP-dependent 3-hydroxy acid dehydrogenase YdfG